MNKNIITVITVVFLLCTGLGAVSFAQDRPAKSGEEGRSPAFSERRGPPWEMPDGGNLQERVKQMEEIDKSLGISGGQAEKLKKMRQARSAIMKKLEDAIRAKHEAVMEELKKKDYDEKTVRKLHAEGRRLEDVLDDNRLEGMLELRKTLTDTQFKKLMELLPFPGGPGMPFKGGFDKSRPPRGAYPALDAGPGSGHPAPPAGGSGE